MASAICWRSVRPGLNRGDGDNTGGSVVGVSSPSFLFVIAVTFWVDNRSKSGFIIRNYDLD